jgi:transposase
MNTYSMDLRERVVSACDAGKWSRQEIADRFNVSTSWIRRLLQRRRERRSIEPLQRGGYKKPVFEGKLLKKLDRLVEQQPDATLKELRDRSGANCSIMAVHRALQRLDCRLKKRR